jgi:hypothetical protein
MSEQILSIFITVLVIALMFVWVPVLEFICPPCRRALERLRSKRAKGEVRQAGQRRAETSFTLRSR